MQRAPLTLLLLTGRATVGRAVNALAVNEAIESERAGALWWSGGGVEVLVSAAAG
jgi:hypothetical protein